MSDMERLAAIRARCEAATPGPWRVQPMGNGSRINGGGSRLRMVADVPAKRDEDARLIAAAPDLLLAVMAAINHLCSGIRTKEETVGVLWNAYKKASGLGETTEDDGDMNMGQQEDGAEGVNLSAAVDNLRNQVIAAVIHDMGLLWAYIRKLRERLSM